MKKTRAVRSRAQVAMLKEEFTQRLGGRWGGSKTKCRK